MESEDYFLSTPFFSHNDPDLPGPSLAPDTVTDWTALHLTTPPPPDDGSHTLMFSEVLGIGVTGVLCLFGLAGNVLSVVVLGRAFANSPMFYVLRVLSVSDALFLLSVFTLQTVVNVYPHLHVMYACHYYRAYIQYIVWPVMMTTQMASVWLTVLVSIERYIAICHPLRAAYVCTLGKVRWAVLTIVFTAVVFNIPRYWEFSAEVDQPMKKTDIGTNTVYRYLYTCLLYSVQLFFLPLGALFYLNVRLVIALKRGKQQWKELQLRQRREQNLTIIPLSIVCIFFVCGTPSVLVNIADSMHPILFDHPPYLAFMVFANFLVVVNSASNVIVYFLLGRRFRSRVAEMLRWLFCSTVKRPRALSESPAIELPRGAIQL